VAVEQGLSLLRKVNKVRRRRRASQSGKWEVAGKRATRIHPLKKPQASSPSAVERSNCLHTSLSVAELGRLKRLLLTLVSFTFPVFPFLLLTAYHEATQSTPSQPVPSSESSNLTQLFSLAEILPVSVRFVLWLYSERTRKALSSPLAACLFQTRLL
jgi:hypothetical protein